MNTNHAVILSACRTPIGTFLGNLAAQPATRLGAIVVQESVRRAGITVDQVDEVILGNVLPAGLGQAPARQAALHGGLPPTVAALTVNKVCGSGLKAVMLAAQAVRLGDAAVVVAGGMESMSRAPHLLTGARTGWKFGNQQVTDSMLSDGLRCAFEHCHMGEQAEGVARSHKLSRAEQDEYARESQARAVAAVRAGLFQAEIIPVDAVAVDQGPRADTSLEKLAQLKPVFAQDGTVTAGNASQLSDGAAAVVVAGADFAEQHRLKPLARILAYATAGVEPRDVFLAPIPAVQAALQKSGLVAGDIDLWEVNEAFAAQMLACIRGLDIPRDRLNVHGGAIALGHPLGASGARVLVTLLHALQQRGQRRGLAALCLGGGNAVALIVERVE